ncbi:cobyrinic acid a,c-diamide synthase [Bathymodiolus thermophilus thioautotrophic gill symbiont]|uniref:Cobyrinate a,c-diamide synthase n=1 Tax=Bathymodiolus thermophilus thioautotrophic gill symbiont TaxID=2360 RepID=A0A3G3INN2_9GAMM|nr:cobyrinate a,c-diamide synthase [Bathymodiolus thermophilus thioautotrophic gill symbiont]AYQ57411.1 cobyrinic acid a,c-diamide synthase [Bathymodiolus thermophilus thioautotrophic gill symbiont]
MPSSIYLSAAHKSSGKTVVSLGLCAAFKAQALKVASFKKGPDYIDPLWLAQASGNACYNLDFYNMTNDEIIQLYRRQSQSSDIAIIEGNKGLYDGMSVAGGDANADMAKLLNIPVILVIDANGITRGVAPLLMGYQAFDTEVNIAGVILNKVAGERHESKLIQAIEHYTDIPVVGAVRRAKDLIIDERHLGLMPANESTQSQAFIDGVARIIADQVDLSKISTFHNAQSPIAPPVLTTTTTDLTIAVAKDQAFGFYYQDDLDAFQSLGVNLVYFDTLKAVELPQCDGLFIGGGFPEMQLETLSANQALLDNIKLNIQQGLPTYAECGGLMYLSRKITYQGKSHKMVGVIQADTIMTSRPIGRGYVQLAPSNEHPWNEVAPTIYAHEFHYSKLENIDPKTRYAYKVLRGVGVDNKHDGILTYNLLATYTHLRSVGSNHWTTQFVNFIKEKKIARG